MAKLPGIADLGPAPTADSARPVGTYDATGIARGAAAIGQGAEKLGAGLNQLGTGLHAYAEGQGHFEQTKGLAQYQVAKIDLDAQRDQDVNYGPDAAGRDMSQRYAESLSKIRDGAAASISDPRAREQFLTHVAPDFERGVVAARARGHLLSSQAENGYSYEVGYKRADGVIKADDDKTRETLMRGQNDQIDGLVTKGILTPEQGIQRKQEWALQTGNAFLKHVADTDPQRAVNLFREAPGSEEELVNRFLEVEGKSKNRRSSATGAGQFIDGTWLEQVRKNRPDLANGRSDQDILALRADENLGREMTTAYLRQNTVALKKQGIETSPGNVYMAHFLGAGGAAAVLKADPNMPVQDALARALGPEKAKAMVDANPEVLRGKLAGSVKEWADDKMGGGTLARGFFAMLRPDQREDLLSRAQANLDKESVQRSTAFTGRVQDAKSEALNTGAVTNPISKEEFIGNLGAERGEREFQQYDATVQAGRTVKQLAMMTPEQRGNVVQSLAPKPGEDGYALKQHAYEIAVKAKENIEEAMQADPAGFAIQRLPASGEAYKRFSAVSSSPTASVADRQAAARNFAAVTLAEQLRAGISPENVRLFPKAYIEQVKASLDDPRAEGGTLNVWASMEKQRQLWGDNFPMLYKQLAADKTVSPLVKVIGAGVQPLAGQLLVELKDLTPSEILKGESKERLAPVIDATREAMAPFARTLMGHEGATATLNAFNEQAQKLAAFHVAHGEQPPAAAAKAVQSLIGFKYDFENSLRIPKFDPANENQPFPFKKTDMTRGAYVASQRLEGMDLLSPVATGVGQAYLQKIPAATLKRDGVWVTSSGDGKVGLVWNNAAVLKPDGQPYELSWADLNAFSADYGRKYGEPASGHVDERHRRFRELYRAGVAETDNN